MSEPIDARACVGSHDWLFITLDTLRLDVAEGALAAGLTPNLKAILPGGRWEARHTPASFTYAAHQAFFAGFLPTPIGQGPHPRLFAARFPGAQSLDERTFEFDAPHLPGGLGARGYHSICVGGTGFFNRRTPLGEALPALFDESWWDSSLGVTDPASTANQVALALARIALRPLSERLLVFVNISALHQPNCIFAPGETHDSPSTQAAALAYVDSCLPPLFEALRRRAPVLTVICSDHGTAYGEDGYEGHRIGHPVVWTVPYMQAILPKLEVEA